MALEHMDLVPMVSEDSTPPRGDKGDQQCREAGSNLGELGAPVVGNRKGRHDRGEHGTWMVATRGGNQRWEQS